MDNNSDVIPIKILHDNYVWVMINKNNKHSFIVDPGEAVPVLDFIKKNGLTPDAILITHHHHDHTGGVADILLNYDIPVYAHSTNKLSTVTNHVKEGDQIRLEKMNCILDILFIPGHTLDHIAYYIDNILFCGDTLFSGGCGRVFEGSYEQIFSSLEKIAALPDDTKIYCTHEYTLENLIFAQTIDPDNLFLQEYLKLVQSKTNEKNCTLPSTLKVEKKINPFLRCNNGKFVEQLSKHKNIVFKNGGDVFKYIRELKNDFVE